MPSIIASACMLFVLGIGFFTLPLKAATPAQIKSACYLPFDRLDSRP